MIGDLGIGYASRFPSEDEIERWDLVCDEREVFLTGSPGSQRARDIVLLGVTVLEGVRRTFRCLALLIASPPCAGVRTAVRQAVDAGPSQAMQVRSALK